MWSKLHWFFSGGRNKIALKFEEVQQVVTFLSNYAGSHVILMPGFTRDNVKVLGQKN